MYGSHFMWHLGHLLSLIVHFPQHFHGSQCLLIQFETPVESPQALHISDVLLSTLHLETVLAVSMSPGRAQAGVSPSGKIPG